MKVWNKSVFVSFSLHYFFLVSHLRFPFLTLPAFETKNEKLQRFDLDEENDAETIFFNEMLEKKNYERIRVFCRNSVKFWQTVKFLKTSLNAID